MGTVGKSSRFLDFLVVIERVVDGSAPDFFGEVVVELYQYWTQCEMSRATAKDKEEIGCMVEPLKLLIVDDDRADRMAIREAVMRSNLVARCDEVCSGAEALAALRGEDYNCVFLNFWLPDTDSLSLIKEIRQADVKVPSIVLTGRGDEQTAVNLMKAGASDYLSKSNVSSDNLAPLVRNAIRLYEAECETALAYQKLHESNELLKKQNRELEEQRQQIHLKNLQLIEVSRLKSEFLSTISHELRTPLNAIIGFSQLLSRQYPDPLTSDQLDMIERILSNGKNLLAIFSEVLDFSRLEANRLELICEPFDLECLVTTITYELKPLTKKGDLKLIVKANLAEPIIKGDKQKIRQIAINLLSNAVKFTEKGTIYIELNSIGTDWVEIAVCDSGIGIPEEQLDRIFEAFVQVDQTTKRRFNGTGLGLAIVHSLVKLMNGSISVESQLGRGSEFRVRIPRNALRTASAT